MLSLSGGAQSHLNGVDSEDLNSPLSMSYADDFERTGNDKHLFLPGDLGDQPENDVYQGKDIDVRHQEKMLTIKVCYC